MKPVPLVYTEVGNQGVREVDCVLRSGKLREGSVGKRLETAFAEHTGAPHAVALDSGTAALQLALQAHGVTSGDEVVIPSLCLPPVAAAVVSSGAQPVFADVDPYTYTIAPEEVSRVITERTRAVVAVHLFGQPCDMDRLSAIAQAHDIVLIEVVWDALGARYRDRRVGSHGTSCYSFPQGGHIAGSDGGMLTTNDERVAREVRCMANCGCDERGRMHQTGYSYLMSEVSATIALEHLPRVDSHARLQEYWAMELTHELKDWDGLVTPAVLPGARHAFQRYAVRVSPTFPMTPSTVCEQLDAHGIESVCRPITPLHRHPLFRLDLDPEEADRLSNSDRVASEMVLLPMHPYLEQEQVQRIADALGMMATYVPEGDYTLDPE